MNLDNQLIKNHFKLFYKFDNFFSSGITWIY